ncbi:MAG: RICIN domain-containing protein [Paludibacter sp.]|nr:RICIN domain-containing protein [Paludibacter sp.]
MNKSISSLIILLTIGFGFTQINAQTINHSNPGSRVNSILVAQPIPDRTVLFNVSDSGISKPVNWGLDLAWLSETNIRRGIAFMGADRVDVVRASFQPTLPLVNGDLQTQQVNDLNSRLNLIDLTGSKTKVVLNCDHPSVDPSYIGNAANWALLMDVTTRRVQERGRTVISISPFNEPDYGWGQYSGQNGKTDFYNICNVLRQNHRFDSIRLCGGNTLNDDQALTWYNYLKGRLDEGNTHQLAGSFDNYASFYQTVRANGDHATADELHNVMEAMVGVEYGMQTGIWWGTAELARGEFVKASFGKRLGYAEHRPNWTAASVYRNPEGKIQAFGGTSERQAVTTTYRFVSKDRDVFYEGYGPQREYTMVLPGGTGYGVGQTNAERVVNVTWGEDIQPAINGRYVLVNRYSHKLMEVVLGSTTNGATICQRSNKGTTYQQWDVIPVDSRVGGDFSYFTLTNVNSSKVPDVLNFSLDNGAAIIQWDDSKGPNQQWYLEYVEDGWFNIRNRNSAKCMQVGAPYITDGAVIQQGDKNGAAYQQWRFLPVGAPIEFSSPIAPVNLITTSNSSSIRLDWSPNPETDLSGYTVFRSDSTGGSYTTLARNVTSSTYVDNTITSGKQYFYTIKAVDKSLNRSPYSNEVSATAIRNKDLVTLLQFEGNTQDSTINLNHSASFGGISYVGGKIGSRALALNGTNAFVQLPTNLANHQEITIAMWVYWKGGATWQRIFDFGNDQTENMFLTTNSDSGQLRFSINKGGVEQRLNAPLLPTGIWSHVAVTLGASGASLYVNGILVSESNAVTFSPMDFKPVLNYIGRSQFPDPLFNGNIDDFRVYNYAMTADEIAHVSGVISGVSDIESNKSGLFLSPVPTSDILNVTCLTANNNGLSTLTMFNAYGRMVMSKEIKNTNNTELNVSNLPTGIYMLKLITSKESIIKKLIIEH